MPRYFEERQIVKAIDRHMQDGNGFDILDEDITVILEGIKAADVRENVRGEWVKGGEQPYFRKHFDIVVCSKCNKRGEHSWNFCPNCGADMRGDENV